MLDSEVMVGKMIQCFFTDLDELFPPMRPAAENGDLEEVGRLGHQHCLKGTVVYLGAEAAKQAAVPGGVERFCTSPGGTSAEAAEAIDALEHECIAHEGRAAAASAGRTAGHGNGSPRGSFVIASAKDRLKNVLLAVEIETIHTNPKRKRGNDLTTSLTLRVSVSRNREQV